MLWDIERRVVDEMGGPLAVVAAPRIAMEPHAFVFSEGTQCMECGAGLLHAIHATRAGQ